MSSHGAGQVFYELQVSMACACGHRMKGTMGSVVVRVTALTGSRLISCAVAIAGSGPRDLEGAVFRILDLGLWEFERRTTQYRLHTIGLGQQ